MRNILIAILLLVAAVPANANSGCTTADLIGLGVNSIQAPALGCDRSYTKTVTLTFNAFNSVAGATAGWTPPTGLNKALLVCPHSQTNATAVVPVSGLQVGDVITAFKITGQVDSAGNTATVDADLRKLTPATAGTADASIGAITQISKTADYLIADSKTLAAAETVASGESFYVLLKATTAATTDVEISTVEITVTRTF